MLNLADSIIVEDYQMPKDAYMIRNVGAQNNTAYINDTKQKDVQETQNVQKQVMEKQSRVDDLKKQIESGAYQIDLKATATRMAQELRPDL